MVPDEPDLCQLRTRIWRIFVPLTIASEVVRHISSLLVIPPSPMEAPSAVLGVLAPVGHPYSSLHLLFSTAYHHTNLPPTVAGLRYGEPAGQAEGVPRRGSRGPRTRDPFLGSKGVSRNQPQPSDGRLKAEKKIRKF